MFSLFAHAKEYQALEIKGYTVICKNASAGKVLRYIEYKLMNRLGESEVYDLDSEEITSRIRITNREFMDALDLNEQTVTRSLAALEKLKLITLDLDTERKDKKGVCQYRAHRYIKLMPKNIVKDLCQYHKALNKQRADDGETQISYFPGKLNYTVGAKSDSETKKEIKGYDYKEISSTY